MVDNQRRVLAEVLSIDAWHGPIRVEGSKSTVHVELSFQKGRMGGDNPDFPFTFNIALKRAVLTVHLEPPLRLDRNSVARQIPTNQAEFTRIMAARDEAKSDVKFGGKVSPASITAHLEGSVRAAHSSSQEGELKVVQELPRIAAIAKPLGAHDYAWELIPSFQETLEGQPWDPAKEPRFSIVKAHKEFTISPTIKVIVSCKLEDIEITELELKNSSPINLIKEMAFNKVNKAAAIQHLKLTLKDLYLEVGDLGDRFSSLIIADLLSAEQ